jgi:hypothetical protein
MLVYVDDILVIAKQLAMVNYVKAELTAAFDIRDLGPAAHFLGMSILRDRAACTLKLDQSQMVKDLVSQYGMTDCKPKGIPMEPGLRLKRPDSEMELADVPYPELVGSLLYIAVCSRPDIAYPVGALARHMSKYTEDHFIAAKAVVRYLASTSDYGIIYSPDGTSSLVGYCDADYAGDLDTRRSTTGYVFTLHGGAISWNSGLH